MGRGRAKGEGGVLISIYISRGICKKTTKPEVAASGVPVCGRVGQQSSGLLASHQACQGDEWFLPHGRGGVERGGGSCPPMGEPNINLVPRVRAKNIIIFLCFGRPTPSP